MSFGDDTLDPANSHDQEHADIIKQLGAAKKHIEQLESSMERVTEALSKAATAIELLNNRVNAIDAAFRSAAEQNE